MKCFPKTVGFLLFSSLMVSTATFAGWQVATKGEQMSSMPSGPFFQAPAVENTTFMSSPYGNGPDSSLLTRPSEMYAISISGSLKENIERIMDRYHWKVIWKAGYDYNFDGRVMGSSLPNVLGKLFQPFPLQAQLFMSNRTMIVIPRNKDEA